MTALEAAAKADQPYQWWECVTHGVAQHYDGEPPWWDEWSPYCCAIRAEYPVEGVCVPRKVVVVEDTGGLYQEVDPSETNARITVMRDLNGNRRWLVRVGEEPE